jgi:hypothetical protein
MYQFVLDSLMKKPYILAAPQGVMEARSLKTKQSAISGQPSAKSTAK